MNEHDSSVDGRRIVLDRFNTVQQACVLGLLECMPDTRKCFFSHIHEQDVRIRVKDDVLADVWVMQKIVLANGSWNV